MFEVKNALPTIGIHSGKHRVEKKTSFSRQNGKINLYLIIFTDCQI